MPATRKTFRHGNLPEALMAAALTRLESDGVDNLSLRELAADVGVNHRAVYRHFPDKLSLLARVAEDGWRRMAKRMSERMAGCAAGEDSLVAGALAFYLFARDNPNLFQLMAGPRLNLEGTFPKLDAAIVAGLVPFMAAFVAAGLAPDAARTNAAVFAAALQGVITQVLHRRLKLAPAKSRAFMSDVARRLFRALL